MNEPQFGEPWTIAGPTLEPRIMEGDPKLCIAVCGGPADDANVPTPEQMERIVACVNFLAGVPTEALLRKSGDPQFINDKPVAALYFPMTPLATRKYAVFKQGDPTE